MRPLGEVRLIANIFWTSSYEHTLDFNSKAEQESYFLTLPCLIETNYSYIRQDKTLKVGMCYEQLRGYNYVMYRNSEDKWIYCFILKKNYINDNNTELVLQVDVMQTYQFDYEIMSSFVHREHQDRELFANLKDETIAYGNEYLIEDQTTLYESDTTYIVSATELCDENGKRENTNPPTLQSVPTTYYYGSINSERLEDFMQWYGISPNIVSIVKLPINFINAREMKKIKAMRQDKEDEMTEYVVPFNMVTSVDKNRVIANYQAYQPFVANKSKTTFSYLNEPKLRTFPYSYNLLSDCQGNTMVIKNEYLNNPNVEIKASCYLSHQPKVKYWVSSGYKGDYDGKTECLINENYSQLALSSNAYQEYIMNNANSINQAKMFNLGDTLKGTISGAIGGYAAGLAIPIPVVDSLVGAIGGAIIGGASSLWNGYKSYASEVAKQKDLDVIPNSIRSMGGNSGFDVVDGNHKLIWFKMSITEEEKQKVAMWFHIYGYNCQEMKVPNLKSRYYFNFIQMSANLRGRVDYEDLELIKKIYENGITIWHYRSDMRPLDYTRDNTEVRYLNEEEK